MVYLYDVVDIADLIEGIDAGLISEKHSDDGYSIFNYTNAAMYTPGAWDNYAVQQCRGLIVDESNEIVARPWTKFFNHNQPEAGELEMHSPVEVTDKIDGSMGIIHLDSSNNPRVATRGSFESEQAIHATKWLRAQGWELHGLNEITLLVEIVYPENRVVVDYGDKDSLILLGGVDIATGEYLSPYYAMHYSDWPGEITQVFPYDTLYKALQAPPRPNAEGLCIRYEDKNKIVKIKQEDYVRLHKVVTGLSMKTVWEHMVEGKSLEDLLSPLPDELHPWTKSAWAAFEESTDFYEAEAHERFNNIVSMLPHGYSRKEFAAEASKDSEYFWLLFGIFDGRDIRDMILRKKLKPVGEERAKSFSEETA